MVSSVILERPATAAPQPALRRLHGVRYHRGGGGHGGTHCLRGRGSHRTSYVTVLEAAPHNAVASLGAGSLQRRSSRRAHGQDLRVSVVTFRRTRPAATRRTETHAEHVPSMARHILADSPQQNISVECPGRACAACGPCEVLDGPRCVCMQSDGAGKYNLFFGSELRTLPALSLFFSFILTLTAANPVALVLLTRHLIICLHLSRSTPCVPSMCPFSPSTSRMTHDVVSDVLFVCVHSSLCFSLLLEDGVPYVRLMIHLRSQRGLKQLSSSVCVLSPYRFSSCCPSRQSSPPSSFEAFLDWLQSGVVHTGKPKKQKGRRAISKRQARRRERRLDVKFGAAFVHSPRGPRRGCTAKVSGNS